MSKPVSMAKAQPPQGYWLLGGSAFSLLFHKRSALAALGLALLIVALSGISLASGSADLSASAALAAVVGQGDAMTQFLVQELRLPRLLGGIFTGFAFGVSGCLLQTLARNRLSTPGIIGIDDGATAFAVASIVAVPTSLAPSSMALVGAATATALAFGLGGGAGAKGYRFIVVGIGIGALFGAVTNLMLARTDIDSANEAYPWTVGSLNARPPEALWMLAIGILICLPLIKMLAERLKLMRFSDAVACGLGVNLGQTRLLTLVVAVLLSALAVGVAGPVVLIALVGPEAARYLCGDKQVSALISGLTGVCFMVAADLVGRTLLAPVEIPVGVVTSVVGGPYLLWILLRKPLNR